MADVQYNGKTLSDENLKGVLDKISEKIGTVKVSSADRDAALSIGAGAKSLHLSHQAVDFHIVNMPDADVFLKLKSNKNDIFDSDHKYEVIHHGPHTGTGGAHVHIGRHASGSGVSFYVEGLSPETKDKYTLSA